MSATIGTIAGTTGLGSARQVVWAPVSQLWWAFQFTGTATLASWSSSDGSSWSAGATFTLPQNHLSEGRDLMVTCKPISGIDVIWFTFVTTPTTVYAQYALRATVSGSTITYHSSATKISQTNISGALAIPRYSSGGLEVGTDNKVHAVNGALDPNQDITWIGTTNADPGTAEQVTGPTWGIQTVIDNGQTATVKSGMTFAMPSGDLFHIGDDGSADSTLTDLVSYTLPSGGSWSTVGSALGGTIGAVGKNNWGAVKRTDSDIHLVYRTSAGVLTHRRYDGTSWSAGQIIPSQSNLDGGGVALCSDGVSVWLAIIDTDGANTIRYIQWASNDYTGHGDAWKSWQVLEGSSATRTFLGLARDTNGSFILLAYWTEGSSMMAATAEALFPDDPPGLANRDALSALGTSLASTTVDVVFTGTQPTASKRQKIIVGFWANYSTPRTVSTVADLCTSPNTYTATASNVGSAQGAWIYWLDLPVGATWSGNYTIRVTFSGATTAAEGGAIAYSNMASGAPTAINNNTGTSTTATPGSCTPPEAPATYFVVVTDATGANPATFTWPAPYLKEITQSNGSGNQAGSVGDALNSSGARNPSITIDSSLFNAAQAVFPGAPAIGNTYVQAFPQTSGRVL